METVKQKFRKPVTPDEFVAAAASHGTEPDSTTPTHVVQDGVVPHQTKPDQTKPAKTIRVVKATRPKRTPAPVVVAPWASANERIPVGFNLRMNEVLHQKALFLLTKLPGMSQQKLYLQAIEEKIDALLKLHWEQGNLLSDKVQK